MVHKVMSNKTKVLLVDLLHIVGGSLDEDIASINSVLSVDYETKYLKISFNSGILGVFKVYKNSINFLPSKIIFLSSRVNQLFLFIPLILFCKCYFIYHFMPNHRIKFHTYALPILANFYKVGVYSNGVATILSKLLGYKPDILPSRIIDCESSFNKLRHKLFSKHVNLFIPGIRPGVRKSVDLQIIIDKINALGIGVDTIYVQTEDNIPDYAFNGYTPKIIKLGYMEPSQYIEIYSQSLFVAINFDEAYEVRASGVILDALNSGSIILTKDHPIVFQYGYPNTVVTNIENIDKVFSKIKNLEDCNEIIQGHNFKGSNKIWNAFLK